MRIFFIFALFIVSVPAFAQTGDFQVGKKTRLFTDETRTDWAGTAPRPLLTMIWYPAANDAKEQEVVIGEPDKPIFISGYAAREAKILTGKKRYPLVVLSHGTGGSALQLMWLGEYLAKRGFIVAAANHHGNTGAEDKPNAQGSRLWWERDLSVTIDKMLADNEFGGLIDQNKIGIAGFSIGGTTVISVAGAIFNFDELKKFCASPERDATCSAVPENPTAEEDLNKIINTDPVVIASLKRAQNSYLDKRVKAVFAIAPALGYAFTAADTASIKVPVQIVVGAKDMSAPAATNAVFFNRVIKNSKLTILPGEVSHYVFLSECGAAGKQILPPMCADEKTVDRRAVHEEVRKMALKFFRQNL